MCSAQCDSPFDVVSTNNQDRNIKSVSLNLTLIITDIRKTSSNNITY